MTGTVGVFMFSMKVVISRKGNSKEVITDHVFFFQMSFVFQVASLRIMSDESYAFYTIFRASDFNHRYCKSAITEEVFFYAQDQCNAEPNHRIQLFTHCYKTDTSLFTYQITNASISARLFLCGAFCIKS